MRAYPLHLHAPRYEEEVGCRANAENEFVALKKVRCGKQPREGLCGGAMFSRTPISAPETSQAALWWLKLLTQTAELKRSHLAPFKVLTGPQIEFGCCEFEKDGLFGFMKYQGFLYFYL